MKDYGDAPNGSTYCSWSDVILLKGGNLVIEHNDIHYSSHSIGHNTGRNTNRTKITFDQLPELILRSKDERAAHYIGMNKSNWRKYVREDFDEE